MRLIDEILNRQNIISAVKAVKSNKGAAGVDNVTVDELDAYFIKNWNRIKGEIISKKYKPQPVRRVYIPKANGGKRPLGNFGGRRQNHPAGDSKGIDRNL